MTTRFGPFVLERKLEVDHHGVRYQARGPTWPRDAPDVSLLWVFETSTRDPAFLEDFRRGARIAMDLRHENIRRVLELGQVDDAWYLTSEGLDATDLHQLEHAARRKGLPWLPSAFAVGIIIDVCRALHAAHTFRDERGQPGGVTHDALSPGSARVTFTGDVKLEGFGIERIPPPPGAGVLQGKRLYLSPEQCHGRPLDARSDVYVVGLLLYRMLCATLPFGMESDFSILRDIVEGRLTPAETFNPTLDPPLREILRRALSTDRDARHESAEALARELSDWREQHVSPFSSGEARRHLVGALLHDRTSPPRPPPPAAFITELTAWRASLPRASR
ncbi:serine/threonine protein kinase [Myxococcus sp. K15C18031901]|uniref:serine/threonine protein kinase n=1 Tax=Myxococcus dinghuensis TaxID=2906761 RepID=UPI0020A6DDCC|nr:serine/threonine-protein kinase [Myxococcus dinghuensis]MCP3098350.1 serine/threonine protein kinase [Myxococcus dinghuensis]